MHLQAKELHPAGIEFGRWPTPTVLPMEFNPRKVFIQLFGEGDTQEERDAIARQNAPVNIPQPDGTTSLHWAVYRVDEELVQTLLARGAKADVVNAYGSSPLAEAVRVANSNLVGALLDAGADPNRSNEDGQTPLMLAARTGSVKVADLLVARGANVNAREKYRDQTPLMWAAAKAIRRWSCFFFPKALLSTFGRKPTIGPAR